MILTLVSLPPVNTVGSGQLLHVAVECDDVINVLLNHGAHMWSVDWTPLYLQEGLTSISNLA